MIQVIHDEENRLCDRNMLIHTDGTEPRCNCTKVATGTYEADFELADTEDMFGMTPEQDRIEQRVWDAQSKGLVVGFIAGVIVSIFWAYSI